jgi:serine/threonine protein kinase
MDAQTGKYRDIAELGQGGMGDVFLTLAPGPAGFNKLLVVKRLRDSLASDPEFLRMFLDEARLAARLNHPNIVQTYEVGLDGARHFIAMEYLQGQSFHRLIRRTATTGGFPLEMHLRVLADALAGLHYAHELTDYDGTPLQIVHRDFSPANIFVLYDGQVKLVDFGIAKMVGSQETKAGIFKGKIQYVAPEQYTGGLIDRRVDIYSAGVILWEAVTQRRMWKGAGDFTVLQRVAGGDIPLPSSVEPQVPKRLEAMCMKALSVRREDRYATAAAMQADIEDFLLERGSRVSAREVGAFTAKAFADVRTHLNTLIEDQLRVVRENSDPHSIVPIVTLIEGTGGSITAPDSAASPPFAPRFTRPKIAAAMAGGVALLAGTLALWPSSSPGTDDRAPAHPETLAAPVPPVASAPSVPPPASPAVAHVKLTFDLVPAHARVSIDDASLPPNSPVVEVVKDGLLHKVHAEAAGHRAKTEWVRFDSDEVAVKISLDSLMPARKGRKEPGRETPATTPPSALGESAGVPLAATAPPSPAAAPIREIEAAPLRRQTPAPLDTGDPWKK